MIDSMTGNCLCGAVQFAAEGVETGHHACHCGMCRRWSGGAPFFTADVRALRFTADEALGRYASSEWAERGFCTRCGTTLYYFFKPAGTYAVSVGAFADPTVFELVREICVDRKPPGYALAGDHPRWTEAETFAAYAPPDA